MKRWDIIQKFIVTHDTQEPSYCWDRVVVPGGWVCVDDTTLVPHTRMYTKMVA